jgi:hypothetical protein
LLHKTLSPRHVHELRRPTTNHLAATFVAVVMADTSEEVQDSAVATAPPSPAGAGAGEGDSEGGGAAANNAEPDAPQFLSVNYDTDPTKREIGGEAVWTLSSAKSGNGVDQLRDNSINTFWQSDGTQPHYVNIQFLRKKSVCALSFYLEHKLDESYTPKVLGRVVNVKGGWVDE